MDKNYIKYLCSLAKLEYEEKNLDIITEKIKGINEYAKKLAELDTENIEPLINVNNTVNVFREDEIKPSLDRKIVLGNAPEKMYECIKVSKILE